jgi:hypothetical protein
MKIDYNINTPNNPLKSALTYFCDVLDFSEAEADIRRTYVVNTYGLEDAIQIIESFLASDFELWEVRDFVEYEMNCVIDDPTGKLQLAWIQSALALEKKVLDDLRSMQS